MVRWLALLPHSRKVLFFYLIRSKGYMTVQLQNLNTIHFKKEEKELQEYRWRTFSLSLKHFHYVREGITIVFTHTNKCRHISTHTYMHQHRYMDISIAEFWC